MAKYPIYLELSGRHVVVIGGGAVAVRKAEALAETGARVVVVAKKSNEAMVLLGKGGSVRLIKDSYAKDFLVGAVLAIAATNDNDLNRQIYKDCQELEVLCNVVDVPELCDFYVPAVIHRGPLQIAIGTDGSSPAYAGHLRKKLEQLITEQHGEFLKELKAMRKLIQERVAEENDRKILAGKFVDDDSFEKFLKEGAKKWRDWAEQTVESYKQGD